MDSERSGVTRLTVFRFTRFDDIGLCCGCLRVSESVFSCLRAGEVELERLRFAAVVWNSCRQRQDRVFCFLEREAEFSVCPSGLGE
jgi:hypothetical protein